MQFHGDRNCTSGARPIQPCGCLGGESAKSLREGACAASAAVLDSQQSVADARIPQLRVVGRTTKRIRHGLPDPPSDRLSRRLRLRNRGARRRILRRLAGKQCILCAVGSPLKHHRRTLWMSVVVPALRTARRQQQSDLGVPAGFAGGTRPKSSPTDSVVPLPQRAGASSAQPGTADRRHGVRTIERTALHRRAALRLPQTPLEKRLAANTQRAGDIPGQGRPQPVRNVLAARPALPDDALGDSRAPRPDLVLRQAGGHSPFLDALPGGVHLGSAHARQQGLSGAYGRLITLGGGQAGPHQG